MHRAARTCAHCLTLHSIFKFIIIVQIVGLLCVMCCAGLITAKLLILIIILESKEVFKHFLLFQLRSVYMLAHVWKIFEIDFVILFKLVIALFHNILIIKTIKEYGLAIKKSHFHECFFPDLNHTVSATYSKFGMLLYIAICQDILCG